MPKATPGEPARKKRILVVEDDASIASIYCDKLAREGFEVSLARDGEEGIAMAFALRPDLILLDILLPKKDGFEVLHAVKEDDRTRMVPVVMWTNLSREEEAKEARRLGAVDYLVKVYNMPSEVVRKVQEHLGMEEDMK